jgi:hypothetical protein
VLGRWMRTRYRIGFRVGYRHSFRWIQHFRNECRFFTPCYIAGAVSGEVMTINKQTLVIE